MHRLRKYTNECFSRLSSQLKKYATEDDVETLHKIRVEIKKIKAVLQLINTYVKGFHAHRNFIPLRAIFRAAGKIREPDLYYELLLRHKVEIEGLHIPGEDTQAALTKEFKSAIQGFILGIRKKETRLEKHLRNVSKAQVKKYVKRRKKSLRIQLNGKWTEQSLHKARKLTKEIHYAESMLRKTKANPGVFYDRLQDLIGQWHDRQLLLPLLVQHKSPEIQRLQAENEEGVKRIREFVSNHYGANK